MPVFALLTDFGIVDPYVAQMKGMLLRKCPGATICDVTHHIPPQDVASAAWVLRNTMPHFPDGTIFLCVVDPGVGTNRDVAACQIGDWVFVGPDNGLPSLAAEEFGVRTSVAIDLAEIGLSLTSNTFHGRDVMAPVAARIGLGQDLGSLGRPIAQLKSIHSFGPGGEATPGSVKFGVSADGCRLTTSVEYIDHFGNVVLKGRSNSADAWRWLGQSERLQLEFCDQAGSALQKSETMRRVETYGFAEPTELILVEGSQGQYEIAVVGGSASQRLGLRIGQIVELVRQN